MLQVNIREELFFSIILYCGHCGSWGLRNLSVFLQSCIFWTEQLSFGHYIHKIFKAFSITVLLNWPVVLCASVQAFPEERADEGDRDKLSSRLQAATNLGEERTKEQYEKKLPLRHTLTPIVNNLAIIVLTSLTIHHQKNILSFITGFKGNQYFMTTWLSMVTLLKWTWQHNKTWAGVCSKPL